MVVIRIVVGIVAIAVIVVVIASKTHSKGIIEGKKEKKNDANGNCFDFRKTFEYLCFCGD